MSPPAPELLGRPTGPGFERYARLPVPRAQPTAVVPPPGGPHDRLRRRLQTLRSSIPPRTHWVHHVWAPYVKANAQSTRREMAPPARGNPAGPARPLL